MAGGFIFKSGVFLIMILLLLLSGLVMYFTVKNYQQDHCKGYDHNNECVHAKYDNLHQKEYIQ